MMSWKTAAIGTLFFLRDRGYSEVGGLILT